MSERAAVLIFALALGLTASHAAPHAQSSSTLPPDVVKLLQAIRAADTDRLAVSEEDARFLRLMVFPRLVARGPFLAHNVVNKQAEMRDFLGAIQNNPAMMTTIVSPSAEGVSVTLKLR